MATLVFSSAFLKSYSNLAATNSARAGKVFEALRKLEHEQYDSGLRIKKIKGVAVWEARFDDAGRLLFVYDREHVRRDGTITAEKVIRVGYMLCDHDKVIDTARRGYAGWLSAELEDTDGWKDWFETRLPASPVALTRIETVAKELPDEDFWNVYWNFAADCEATPDNNREGRLWYLTEVDALKGGTAENMPRELLLVPQQYEALNAHLPLLLKGSAGSGKTTVALYKMRDIADANPNSTMAYVSYNAALVRKAEEWFRLLPRRDLKLENVHFLTYEALLRQWLAEGETQTNRRVANYADFLTFYRKQLGSKQGTLIWSEIRSVIKGSFADSQLPQKAQDVAASLTEKQYVNLPARWSALQPDQRKSVFKVFEGYEKFLKSEGLEDEQDVATRALRLTLTDKARPYDFLFLDETQDLTEKQLNVLMRLANRLEGKGLLLAGDPTQMLQPTGAAWRFVTGDYHKHKQPQPNAHNLERNFRCAIPVVRLAAAILVRLKAAGVDNLEWPKESSHLDGDVPVLTPDTPEVLADLRTPLPNRTVLVADDETKARMTSELENPFVWTVLEAKGLEWDHVVLYALDADVRPLNPASNPQQRAAVQQEQQNALRHLYVAVTRALDTVTIVITAEPHKYSLWSHPDVQHCLHVANDPATTEPVVVPNQPKFVSSTPEEWLERGHYYRNHEQWNAAMQCYQQAGSEMWRRAVQSIHLFRNGDYNQGLHFAQSIISADDSLSDFMSQELISCRSQRLRMLTPENTTAMLEAAIYLFVVDAKGLGKAVRDNNLNYIRKYVEGDKDVNAIVDAAGVSALHVAAEIGNSEAINILLQAGANPNLMNLENQSPLGIAIRSDNEQIVKLLLYRGANANAICDRNHTALTLAATVSLSMVQTLISNRTDVNIRDAQGLSALTWATRQNCLKRVQLLVEHGADVNDGKIGSYALQATAWYQGDAVAVARYLVKCGARYEPDGNSALSQAIKKQSIGLICLLIQQGANVNEPQVSRVVRRKNVVLDTPEIHKTPLLMDALNQEKWDSAIALIVSGADINCCDEDGMITALGRAVQGNCPSVVEQLLTRGANPNTIVGNHKEVIDAVLNRTADVSTFHRDGMSALECAINNHQIEIAEMLVKYGANIGVQPNGTKLMMCALGQGIARHDYSLVQLLVEQGVDVDAEDDDGDTPLTQAISLGNSTLVKLFLQHGADPNKRLKTKDKLSPLGVVLVGCINGLSTRLRQCEILHLLLQYGADINMTDDTGNTALMHTVNNEIVEVARALIDAGANVNVQNSDGVSSLGLAVANDDVEMTRILITAGADVNVSCDKGITPLALAKNHVKLANLSKSNKHSLLKSTTIAELLINVGANK